MKVKVDTWRGVRQMDLAEALQPCTTHDGGEVEQIRAQVQELTETVGKLAALLVESGRFDLDDVARACGQYTEITPTKD